MDWVKKVKERIYKTFCYTQLSILANSSGARKVIKKNFMNYLQYAK